MIESGEDPNELESEDGGSDSEPEEDLFKPNEWYERDLKENSWLFFQF